jgi:hypothetical protein
MVKRTFYITTAITIILSLLTASCRANINLKALQKNSTKQEKPKPNMTFTYGELLANEKSDYLMFPVIGVYLDNNRASNYLMPSGSYDKGKNIYNMIFYDKKEGAPYLLLRSKALINSYEFIERKVPGSETKRFMFYGIINKDTNGDQKLTTEDAIIGYISDSSGRNLRQITPSNTQMQNWKVIQSLGSIFIKIVKDTNNDKKFTAQDVSNYVRVNLDNPGTITEVFGTNTEEQIKSIIDK